MTVYEIMAKRNPAFAILETLLDNYKGLQVKKICSLTGMHHKKVKRILDDLLKEKKVQIKTLGRSKIVAVHFPEPKDPYNLPKEVSLHRFTFWELEDLIEEKLMRHENGMTIDELRKEMTLRYPKLKKVLASLVEKKRIAVYDLGNSKEIRYEKIL